MTEVSYKYLNDLASMFVENSTISSGSWVAFGGTLKIKLEEGVGRGRPNGRTIGVGLKFKRQGR